jgi:hypothetical protein
MRAELPIAGTRMRNHASAADKTWSWIVEPIQNPEFVMVALFCTVGLWLTFYIMHLVPDFGQILGSLDQF